MKYFIIITFTLCLIQWTSSLDLFDVIRPGGPSPQMGDYDYDEDADPNDGFVPEDTDVPPKPIYKLEDAPKLFEQFKKDFNKKYKNKDDLLKHYKTFVDNLKEINRINSDKEVSSTADINLFADLSPEERSLFLGGPE